MNNLIAPSTTIVRMLREYGRALPIGFIAQKMGRGEDGITDSLNVLRKNGVIDIQNNYVELEKT